ncbi:DUF320 domain-containing protein [Streptomyces sp. AC563]|nr:DUF320 domain-containing protein [Streptomyces buecherae]
MRLRQPPAARVGPRPSGGTASGNQIAAPLTGPSNYCGNADFLAASGPPAPAAEGRRGPAASAAPPGRHPGTGGWAGLAVP